MYIRLFLNSVTEEKEYQYEQSKWGGLGGANEGHGWS